jgi:membrane protease YdiL (CAAX protease family)
MYGMRFASRARSKQHWADWFTEFRIAYNIEGSTILRRSIVDQAALHGVLIRVHDLSLTLLSVNQVVPGDTPPTTKAPKERNPIMATITPAARPATSSPLKRLIADHPLSAYFVLAFGLMWLFAVPLAFSRNQGSGLLPYDLSNTMGNVLFLLTTFSGPTVATLIVTRVIEGRTGVLRLLKRFVQWRVKPRWYIVVLGINVLIWLLAYTALVGSQLIVEAVARWPLLLSTYLPLVAFGMIIPAIAEEPGWRGFALPRLQQRYGPIAASLILGTLHGLWHLPALMTMNFGPLPLANYLPFIITVALATLIYTWVYNHTGGSILIALLLHAASNASTGWLTTLIRESGVVVPDHGMLGFLANTSWINAIAYGLVALVLIIGTRARLGYQPANQPLADHESPVAAELSLRQS